TPDRGRIHNYEVSNEPNLRQFYTGSPKEMVEMAREAYSILKQVDSTVVVVSPSAVGEGGLNWLDQYLALGGAKYLDVLGYHLYEVSNAPEAMLSLITSVHQVAAKYGLSDR